MQRLLAIIAGGSTSGYLEVRSSLPGRGMRQEFFRAGKDNLALTLSVSLAARESDVFIGAAPRTTKHGGRAAVPQTWALWVDCDDVASTARLAEFQPRPTLTIASGSENCTHAWWSLAAPLPALHAERANRRLAHHLGADPRCAEVARIMRPPDTLNHKSDPPSPVTVLEHNPGTVSVVMAADLPDPVNRRPSLPSPRRSVGMSGLDGLSALEYVPRLTGREPNSAGYVQCPFHKGGQERTPSLKCYPDGGGWACFGCQDGGTIYDFAAKLWNVPTRGAAFLQLKQRLHDELLA